MSRESLLLSTFVELADSLVDDFDVVDLLTGLTHRCVEVLDVVAAGVMLAASDGDLRVVASSSETMRALELFELQEREGPCVDSFRSGEPIVNRALSADGERWPAFTSRARRAGFVAVHALPMRLRGRTIGALNLFGATTVALDDADILVGQALADVATIAILANRAVRDAMALHQQLDEALTSRIVIEQAKGRVSEAAGLDMNRAFERMRSHARSHSLRLSDLARDIASGAFAPTALDSKGSSDPS